MIRLLADENFPLASIEILKVKYDILSIAKLHSGISDSEIIKLANREERLILTFDRDFGQLIFKEELIPQRVFFIFVYNNSKILHLLKLFLTSWERAILMYPVQSQLLRKIS